MLKYELLSKRQQKIIKSLKQKKYRDELGLFVVEGTKTVNDLLDFYRIDSVFATESWYSVNQQKLETKSENTPNAQYVIVSDSELKSLSLQQNPQEVLIVFKKPLFRPQDVTIKKLCDEIHENKSRLYLVLDGIQDPGNLGTIIRTADWFGIRNIICSLDTADVYNPKVIQSTMGSLARVSVYYLAISEFLHEIKGIIPIYGTLLDGKDIYGERLTAGGVIVMGNEGNGISESVRSAIDKPLLIPCFGQLETRADSLNVATATAIVCSEFCRRSMFN